jgi:hypothetical protein
MTHPLANKASILEHFRKNGYVILENALTPDEVVHYTELFDRDRREFGHPNCWHPFGGYQTRNCNALVTTPEFDGVIRHPKVLPVIEFLMGGPVCFAETCLRHMAPYDGEPNQHFHRDRPHWLEHPLRMEYIQMMLYLTDVDESTHCFSLSPESVDEPIVSPDEQVARRGIVDFHGRAGTIALFNIAVPHTATVRVTQKERKSIQTYYGHRARPFLSDCSVIPPRFWRYDPDAEVRAFYGNLNRTTRVFLEAFNPDDAERELQAD